MQTQPRTSQLPWGCFVGLEKGCSWVPPVLPPSQSQLHSLPQTEEKLAKDRGPGLDLSGARCCRCVAPVAVGSGSSSPAHTSPR